jgi:hypothetical protein
MLSQAQEAHMETAVQIRQSINITALATLLVAVFIAVMGSPLNATLLSMAGLALIGAARWVAVAPRRAGVRRSRAPAAALCAHL